LSAKYRDFVALQFCFFFAINVLAEYGYYWAIDKNKNKTKKNKGVRGLK
jgi:hypothetical protein